VNDGTTKIIMVHDIDQDPDRCVFTAGWILLIVGWLGLGTLAWLPGALIPMCDKKASPAARANNKRAAIANGVCCAVSIICIIVVVAISASRR
jgi:hypothetical protein